jgi:hypothetical protein
MRIRCQNPNPDDFYSKKPILEKEEMQRRRMQCSAVQCRRIVTRLT